MELILAILSTLALGNSTLTTSPPSYFQGQAIETSTCHTVSGLKQPVNGTLNSLDYLQKNSSDYNTIMQKLNLNFEHEGALSWFKGASINPNFLDEFKRTKENLQATVWLYTYKNGKPSAQPTALITSWYTNDGKASDTFPFLKTQLIHIQKCELTYSK